MKKINLVLALIFCSLASQAQWTETGDNITTGNLTIGSTVSNSYSKLVIKGPNNPFYSASNRDISFEFSAAGKAQIRSYRGGSWDTYLQFLTTPSSGGNPISRLNISHNGNIGIGTSASDLLHLRGENPTLRLSSNTYYGGSGNGLNTVLSTIKFSNRDDNHNFRAEIRGLLTGGWATSVGLAFTTHSGGQQVERMRINHDGTIGIGTASTFGYQLAVNGTIGSTEVKVENTSAWPDFVFYDNYELRTLEEVEQHINENGHLPEIPSEAEVTENGINLGEMDAKLLQKIEELTLYLIEQNKEIKELKEKMDKLENE